MRKPPKVLTSQQHSQWSAAFLVAAIIVTAIVFGQGDVPKAVAMVFTFILGALCASHGAKSREKKAQETRRGERYEELRQEFIGMEKRLKERRRAIDD